MPQATETSVPKAKPYITRLVIATFKYKMVKTENGMRPTSTTSFTAFEREDGISFNARCASHVQGRKSEFKTNFTYTLKMRKNKKGEIRFRFYSVSPEGRRHPRTSRPEEMRSKISSFFMNVVRQYKNPRVSNEQIRAGMYKAQIKRLYKFIKAFLDKHNIDHKYLSKDPFVLMSQLCYPGMATLEDAVAMKCVAGRMLLDDPLKLALRTKGKKSRRLLYAVLKEAPQSAQSVLRMLKYLRINRSLDEAQRFMELLLEPHFNLLGQHNNYTIARRFANPDDIHNELRVHRLTAKQMKMFDPLQVESIVHSMFGSHDLLADSLRMIKQIKDRQPEFDCSMLTYRSISQLHDGLIAIQRPHNPARRNRIANNFNFTLAPEPNVVFDENSVHITFCSYLAKNFVHDEYCIVYPRSSDELREQSELMHNCSSAYRSEIQGNSFSIFCVRTKWDDRPLYMFGFNAYLDEKCDNGTGTAVMRYAEAKAVCNRMIPQEVMGSLLQGIYGAFGIELSEAQKLLVWRRGTGQAIKIPIASGFLPPYKDPARSNMQFRLDGVIHNMPIQGVQLNAQIADEQNVFDPLFNPGVVRPLVNFDVF